MFFSVGLAGTESYPLATLVRARVVDREHDRVPRHPGARRRADPAAGAQIEYGQDEVGVRPSSLFPVPQVRPVLARCPVTPSISHVRGSSRWRRQPAWPWFNNAPVLTPSTVARAFLRDRRTPHQSGVQSGNDSQQRGEDSEPTEVIVARDARAGIRYRLGALG